MFTKKIVSLAFVALMMIGGTSITAFATEPDSSVDTTPLQIMNTGTGMTLEEFRASGMTLEGLKNAKENLDAKGVTLEEAQAQLAALEASGHTIEGLQSVKAELDAKGITLEEARVNFEGMFNEFTNASGLSPDEAKAKISEMKANGKTLEGLRNIQDMISNIPNNQ